ncbi:MAG TPA: GTPase [Actinoplanes sp.]|nr:GTPase [Actinoplanes sp.]
MRAAVDQGRAELAALDELTGRLVGDGLPEFAGELRQHLDRERESLGSFNIAFFGRTGVGKSTLLSVFGRLDGEYVSPWGASDFTTEVQPIAWRDCRLYDTPGINGWGRTGSRAALEEEARKAVEIADLVLLCFDSQSQQAMEFEKIAAWIRDHGKPAVAVLNVRNPHWRHPARAPQSARAHLSEAVRQHTDNIRTHLAGIDLPHTPVVAIHSRRALLARAGTPFHGPNPDAFHRERADFGTDYLDRWSNIATLEALIVAAIAEGGADLRLAALREDLRSRADRVIAGLDESAAALTRQAETLERDIETLFAVAGYPRDTERAAWLHDDGTDLLELSETARARPYTSPAAGTLDRFVRDLAAAHLSAPRRTAMAAADDLIRTAFEKQIGYDEDRFREAVFDTDAVAAAMRVVETERRSFLQQRLRAAVDDSSLGSAVPVQAAAVRGDEGGGLTGGIVRGTGIAVGAGAAAVPLIALALTNPIGWAIGVTAVGLGIAGQVQQYFGKKITDKSADQARAARAQAIADSHRAVDQTFDAYEDGIVRESRQAAWTQLAPVVAASLRDAVHLRSQHEAIVRSVSALRAYADAINPAPPTADVLIRAQQRLGENTAAVTRVLLGEDWIDDGSGMQAAPVDPAAGALYAGRREQDRLRLARAMTAAGNVPAAVWRDDLQSAAYQDPELFGVVTIFDRVAGARPAVAVLGDYNSGKSSLIRRLLIDSGRQPAGSLDIRATAATAVATRYPLGGVDLVDTPGLQSGDSAHDTAALAQVAEAAVVFVVVHLNFLVGDTTVLDGLTAAKGDRTVFLINRCDELGVDPLAAPEAYLNHQDRKREELRSALASRGVDVGLDRIHCVSGDPFGLFGAADPAGPADFDGNRSWDGVSPLLDAVHGLDRPAASAAAAFDAAVAALRRYRHTLERQQAGDSADLHRAEPVIAALHTAITDAELLADVLREDARRMVNRHALVAKTTIATVDRKDAKRLELLAGSWWTTPEFQTDLDRYRDDAARRLGDWHDDHISAVGREMRAAAFGVAPELAAGFTAHTGAWHETVAAGTSNVAGAAAKIAGALGSRDAVYAIGKQLGHNFKPWGAVKGGAAVAKAGAVLGVIATAADVFTMASDARKDGAHQTQQAAAATAVDAAIDIVVDQIMHGDEGDGPVGHLQQNTRDLEELLREQLDRATVLKDRMDTAATRAGTAEALITAATKGNR